MMRQSIRCSGCQELIPLPTGDEFQGAMGSLYEQAIEERDQSRAEVERLREAVNAYLLAQNHAGWKDGNEACDAARRELCEVVYDLNASDE